MSARVKASLPDGPDPLMGARLKLERARQHIKELGVTIKSYTDRQPYHLAVEKEEGTEHQVVRIRFAQPEVKIPRRLGLIVGDAIYNLRSVLDHLTWQLAVLGAPAPVNRPSSRSSTHARATRPLRLIPCGRAGRASRPD